MDEMGVVYGWVGARARARACGVSYDVVPSQKYVLTGV